MTATTEPIYVRPGQPVPTYQPPVPCPAYQKYVWEHGDLADSEAVWSNDPEKIYAEYDELRKKCPVAWISRHGGYWMLTKYADVKMASSDSKTYISSVKAVIPSDPRGIRRPPLTFDAPAHTPYRTAIERTLKPARLKRLGEVLERHATTELAKITSKGEGNICTDFASIYSAWVECEWLNLSTEVAPSLAVNARAWVASWRCQDWPNVKKYSDGFYSIATDLLNDRKVNPQNPEEDPASSLLLERDSDGEPLEEFHLIGSLRQALVVAMIAPNIMIGSIAKHLSEDKDLQQQLRANPEQVPAAIEEFLRLYVPYRSFARTASKPVTISGQDIVPNQPMAITYTAANRDPDQFPEPAKFILNRDNIKSHLGFGRGAHQCAGMPLARLAMQTFLKVLLRDTKDFEINGPLEHARIPEMGIISCPLKFKV